MEPRGPRACGLLSLLLLTSHLAYNRSLIALTISVDQVTHFLPWVPEDVFFLSILMVRGEAASTRRREKKKTSGHRSYESHFQAILGSYISSNRFGANVHVFFSLTLTAEIWSSTWLCVCDAWEKNCEKAYLKRKVLLKIVTNSFPKKICFKLQVYKKDRSQLRSTHSVYMFLEVKRINRISGLRHLYYCTRSEVKLNIARQNGYAKQNIILLHFLANKPHGELSGITKKKTFCTQGTVRENQHHGWAQQDKA